MTMPNIVDPSVGGGDGVKIRDLQGRALLCQVTDYNPQADGIKQGEKVEQVTFNAMIVDGGDLLYGSNLTNGTPNTHKVSTPYFAAGILASNVNIVRSLKAAAGKDTLVLGVIAKGQTSVAGNNKPWNLVPLEPGDPRRQLAAQLWTAMLTGQFVNPTPIDLIEASSQVPHFTPPVQPAQQVQVPQNPMAAYQVPQAAPQVPQVPAAPVLNTSVAPPSWDPNIWAQIPEAQRAQLLANLQAPTGL